MIILYRFSSPPAVLNEGVPGHELFLWYLKGTEGSCYMKYEYTYYQKIILEANEREDIDAIFPIAVSLKTKEDRPVVAPEIVKWHLKNSTKPDIAPTFFFAKFGHLGGVTIDFPVLGGQAAVKAVRILKGENPGEIPIEEAARYTFTIAINLARADQLGIEIPLEILGMAGQVYKTMNLYPEYEMREE